MPALKKGRQTHRTDDAVCLEDEVQRQSQTEAAEVGGGGGGEITQCFKMVKMTTEKGPAPN